MDYKPRYRAQSLRIPHFDYSQPGYYFVTICTKDREELFGRIENETLLPTNIGTIVERFWKDIPNHFLISN